MLRNALLSIVALVLTFAGASSPGQEPPATSVLIKLIEQVEVPARQSGVLDKVAVGEGDMVSVGDLLAQVDDAQTRLEYRRAQVELAGAAKQADSDVKVRFAGKSLEVAQAELQRAQSASKRMAQSVSASDMDQLRLVVQRNELEIEQAQLEQEMAKSARDLKRAEVEIAQHAIRDRRITAPIAGFVAQVLRHQGEWVQPGQTILRLLRMDRLRAEGLVPAQTAQGDLLGAPVKVTVQLGDEAVQFPGKIVFVSPEIDPVNGQVRVWAEIENTNLQLRPGLHGSLQIGLAAQAPSEP